MQSRLPNFKQLNLGVSNESSQKHLLIRLHIELESFLKNLYLFCSYGFFENYFFNYHIFAEQICRKYMCIKLGDFEKATKFEKKSPSCFDSIQ